MPRITDSIVDVVLISPENRKYSISLPFALLYLSSYLEANSVSTQIIDLKDTRRAFSRLRRQPESYDKVVVDYIKKNRPVLVGLTCYTSEYNSVMRTARMIKESADVFIVVGGVHPTLMPQDFLFEQSPVDFVIMGDGETPLLGLVNSLKRGDESYKKTHGVGYFEMTDKRAVTHGCNVELDLSRFPMPDYQKIDMDFYTRPDIEHVRWLPISGVSIFTGRGCPYNCEFCAVNFLRSLNKNAAKMRYRPVEQVIEEIKLLVKNYRIDGFYVLDDCFMVNEERTTEFCRKLIAERLDLIWGCETRVNLVRSERLLKLMKMAGCIQMDFGVETGSPGMLNAVNKEVTVEEIKTAFRLCRKTGIRTFANILFNLPNETKEDVVLTHLFLNQIKPSVVGCATTVPLLGTALYEKHVFPRLTPQEYELYNLNVYEDIVDKRFKLACHDLDLIKIVRRLNNKYMDSLSNWCRVPNSIPLNFRYWRKILASYNWQKYLSVYMRMLFQKPFLCGVIIFKKACSKFKLIRSIMQSISNKLELSDSG